MDAKNKVRPLRRLIPSRPSMEPNGLQNMRQGQLSANREPDRVLVLYERGGTERIESVSASKPGGFQAAVGSLETPNGLCSERSRYVYEALSMDTSRQEVLVNGREVGLTRKEFDLLECLLKHPGHVRSRDVLLNVVWGYDYYGTARTVDVHIRRLKQKLPLLDRAIVCVRGLGYKLKDTRDEEAGISGERHPGRGLAKGSTGGLSG